VFDLSQSIIHAKKSVVRRYISYHIQQLYFYPSRRSAELARMSGLSGISDIIGDMVAQGEIDLEDVGLSKHEADRLVQRGIVR